MPTDEVKWIVYENSGKNDHNTVKIKIQPDVLQIVEMLQARKSEKNNKILDVEFGSDAPKQNQIYNIVRQTKKQTEGNS